MKNLINKYAVFAIAAIIIFYFVLLAYLQPWVDTDLRSGFIAFSNYLNGTPFNIILSYNHDMIIEEKMLTWWAPGQYAVPYFFSKLFHVNIGYGIVIAFFLLLVAGIFAYYALLKFFKFERHIILASILFLLLQRFCHGIILKAGTSDIFLVFFFSASAYIYCKYMAATRMIEQAGCLVLLFLVFAGGLFVKNSFMLFLVFLTGFFSVYYGIAALRNRGRGLIKATLPAIIGLTDFLLFRIFFYSKNSTPMEVMSTVKYYNYRILNTVIKPFISVVIAPFSFNSFLFRFPSIANTFFGYYFTPAGLVIGLGICSAIYIALYNHIKTAHSDTFYKRLVIFLVLFYVCCWAVFLFRCSYISSEDRLFLPVTLFLIPVIISSFYSSSMVKYVLGLYTVISIVFSVSALYNDKKYYGNSSLVNTSPMMSGFRLHYDKTEINELKQISSRLSASGLHPLIITPSKEAFLLTEQKTLALIVSDKFSVEDARAISEKNKAYFDKYHINSLAFIINKQQSNIVAPFFTTPHYFLYVFKVS